MAQSSFQIVGSKWGSIARVLGGKPQSFTLVIVRANVQAWGACRATSSWSVFILESRHTRTLDGPGKASPEHAIREQFGKLTRAANVERWPEQLQA